MIDQFFIINKSGGMVYKHEREEQTEINALLILTSTLNSLNELSRNVLGTSSYVQSIEMADKCIHIYRTLTGTAFVFVSTGMDDNRMEAVFRSIYGHYCDYVASNPFYQLEMPINCADFQPSQFFG